MQFSLLVAAFSTVVSAASINPKGFVNSDFEVVDVDNLPANVRLANESLKSNGKSLKAAAADAAAICPSNYPLYCRDDDFCCTRQSVGCCRNACCAKGATFCGTDGYCYAYT